MIQIYKIQMAGTVNIPEGFVLIEGGTFQMGSPETESWRSDDETQHTVTVSNFYMSQYELTQEEYEKVMGNNPSNFSGSALPVDNISWLDAVSYCNVRSESEGLTPVYIIDGQSVSWDRSANGYRLPTEAEWEYVCRAGTVTPFHTETSISAEEANYYGHYPYMIEETDPAGPDSGTLRVYRGGGWNDFAKNMRSAYRATLAQDKGSFNIGMRLALNAVAGSGSVTGTALQQDYEASDNENVLIAYFSWGGNTADPYSNDYNTVLDEAQRDQNEQARPELANYIENMEDYDVIILGYPNWWASIPMPIASFLEEYDFESKTIIPFCSHGGGRFGQSLTAIAKLAPDAVMGDALSIHYSGGSALSDDVRQWLEINEIEHE